MTTGSELHISSFPQCLAERFRAYLHQASASTLRQLCDGISDTVLIENNGVTPEWGCNPFWMDCIVFNQSSIASVIAVLMLTLSVNEPLLYLAY